jgi:hypothetical protein
MEESNYNSFEICHQFAIFKNVFRIHLNIYKIHWFYWLDLWINYKIMPLFASFEGKKIKKKMPKLGFPNYFIVNKIK